MYLFFTLTSLGAECAMALLAVPVPRLPALTTQSPDVSLQVLMKWTSHPCLAFPLGLRVWGSFLAHSCHCVTGHEGHWALLRWTFSGHSPDGIDFGRTCIRSSLAVAHVPPAALCCPLHSRVSYCPAPRVLPLMLPLYVLLCLWSSEHSWIWSQGSALSPRFFLCVVLMVRTCGLMLSLSPLRTPGR